LGYHGNRDNVSAIIYVFVDRIYQNGMKGERGKEDDKRKEGKIRIMEKIIHFYSHYPCLSPGSC